VLVAASLLLGAMVSSCAAHTPAPPRASHGAAVKASVPRPPPREVELGRLLAERDALADPRATFSAITQRAPRRPYAVAAQGPFPRPGDAAEIRLYTFGRGRLEGCPAGPRLPFTEEGTLCADVVVPGVVLGAVHRARVESLVPDAEARLVEEKKGDYVASRPVTRCDFDPHHAVAFFDAEGSAIAKILVCFSCGEWIVSPSSEATGGTEPHQMTPAERATLAALFDVHGLAAWAMAGPLADEVRAYEVARFGTEQAPTALGLARRATRLAPGSGAPRDTPMRALSRADRARLCAWIAAEVRPAREPTRTRGYACTSGARWTNRIAEPACATTPTACESTVGEVEACLRVLREPEDLCAAPEEVSKACQGLLGCLPGLTREP